MRRICYSLRAFISGLCPILLTAPSFGSDHFKQEETQEKILTPAPNSQIAVLFSPESALPHEIRVHILSFLAEQKDLLKIGAVSKSWRKAAKKIWEKRWLDLSKKHLTEADYKALAKGIFPRLMLNKVNLDDTGARILATCSHLQALELRGNTLLATESLIKLFSLTRLSHIDLGYNRIGDEGSKAIAGALSQNRTLTSVNLGGNGISDEGAEAIAGALAQNRTLTSVSVNNNSIGDAGAAAMAEAFKQNKGLITVKFYNNIIGAAGAKAMAEAIRKNKTLTTVDLSWNRIGDGGKKALEDLKRSRPSLKLEY